MTDTSSGDYMGMDKDGLYRWLVEGRFSDNDELERLLLSIRPIEEQVQEDLDEKIVFLEDLFLNYAASKGDTEVGMDEIYLGWSIYQAWRNHISMKYKGNWEFSNGPVNYLMSYFNDIMSDDPEYYAGYDNYTIQTALDMFRHDTLTGGQRLTERIRSKLGEPQFGTMIRFARLLHDSIAEAEVRIDRKNRGMRER